jgi:hypothetical protein
MKLNNLVLAGLLCGAPVLASAQVNFGIGVNVTAPIGQPPPPPMVENYGPPPGPEFVWVGGHWAWHHHRWNWEAGHWARHPGFMWAPGHWNQVNGGWVWVEGGWVPAGGVAYAPAPGEVIIQQAPPPPIVETYGPAPGPDFFWIGGRWAWNGGRWGWVGGHWDRHPHWHPGAGWIAGHWNHGPRGYVWVEGRWR